MADSDHPELRIETEPGSGYALSGKIMLSAIVILFAVVVFMGSLHLYARWYLVRLRRHQAERRRNRRSVPRSHMVFYADSRPAAADRGLELKVLNSLPLFLYSTAAEDQPLPECAVCLSEFEDKEIGRLLPKCNHSFHIDCIDMWFRSHSTCPLCRSAVEHVPERVTTAADKPTPTVEIENESVPGPSSRSGEGETASLGNRRKGLELVGVRIDVPLRTELLNELTQSSPASRLLSLRRILSMGRKSPIGCNGQTTTPCRAGTSGGSPEVDLESGLSETTRNLDRVQTSS